MIARPVPSAAVERAGARLRDLVRVRLPDAALEFDRLMDRDAVRVHLAYAGNEYRFDVPDPRHGVEAFSAAMGAALRSTMTRAEDDEFEAAFASMTLAGPACLSRIAA